MDLEAYRYTVCCHSVLQPVILFSTNPVNNKSSAPLFSIGTRAYNCLISAHMRMNDHRSALNALDRLSVEHKFVRRQVEKGGLASLFGEDCENAMSSSSSSSS